jgi:hypothetical protein
MMTEMPLMKFQMKKTKNCLKSFDKNLAYMKMFTVRAIPAPT